MIVIPTTADFPHFRQVVSLNGVTYRLEFVYNGRDASWCMSVYAAGGDVLVSGVRVRADYPLMRQYVSAELPDGVMFCVDVEAARREPGRDDLIDGKFPLVFATSQEVEAL